jgi:excinuclease ABC subunit B
MFLLRQENTSEKSLRQMVEQIIRPTGLLDPVLELKPVEEKGGYEGQVHHFIKEAVADIKKGGRVIATTLTKKMAENYGRISQRAGSES